MGVLRFFLALSVVQYHIHGGNLAGLPFLNGNFAVQAFYLISGFYMALVLHEKYPVEKSSYFEFISNRCLRIFPAYFLVLFLTILLWLWADHQYGEIAGGTYTLWAKNWAHIEWQTKLFMVFSHLALLGQDAFFFLGLNQTGGLHFDPDFIASKNYFWNFMFIPPSWSLSLELYFYLIAPFLVRRSIPVLASMIALSLAVRYVLAHQFGWNGDPWSYRFFPSELALFLCGAGSYRVYRAIRSGKMDAQTIVGWLALSVGVGFALQVSNNLSLLGLVSDIPGERTAWLNVGLVVIVPLALPFLFKFTQHSKIDHHIGELSYPMYLSHTLVILAFYVMQVQNGIVRTAGILSVTLLLSAAIYWWVDRKMDDFRHRKLSSSN